MAAAAPAAIPIAPGAAPLMAPGTGFGPNTAAIGGLPLAPGAPAAVPAGAALAPPGAPTLAALGLTAAQTAGLVGAPAGGYAGGDAYTAAWEKLNLLDSTTQNNNLISNKANEFREIVIGRLRQIFFRIRTLQMLAGGAGAA